MIFKASTLPTDVIAVHEIFNSRRDGAGEFVVDVSSMKLPALTIRKRIYGGSAILVAVGVSLAIFAVDQATTTGAQVVRLGLLSDNNTRVLQVDRNLEVIRRTARSYKTNGDPVALKENREVVARTAQTLTDASKATLSDERRRGYEDLKEDLVKYSAKMDTQVSLTNDMIRDRSKLFQGGDELTATTNRLMEAVLKQNDPNVNLLAANVEAAVLLVRVSNWRYLATLDPKGPVTFKTNTEKAGAAITGLEASAGLAADIRALIGQVKTTLAAYVDTFQLLSSGMVATDAVFDNEARPLVLKMQNSLNTLRNSIQENYTSTQESTKQTVLNSIRTQQAMGIIVFLVGSGIALLLSRGLIRPIAGMTTAMSALAAGDTNVVVPMRDAPDEMGAMAKAVDVFKDNAIERRRLEESQKQREAEAALEKQRAMEALANTFEDAVSEIIETVSASASQLEASAHSLTATATRSEEVTTTVAAASEEASVNVQSVAAATEELTSSVHEISRQVQTSARIAGEAVEQAGKTNGQIALLSEAANRIGNVVQLISTIAGQTNLLALNATIEAARAGEAGRGFAVVASEVKTLAKQTADATHEISQQIAGMQAATGQSVDAIQEIGATIGKMSEISSAIASAVEQQNAATQEISNNVQQAAQGTQEVSANITGVQRGAAETGSASSQVLSAAQSLARDSQRLKSEVTKFLHTVRAA